MLGCSMFATAEVPTICQTGCALCARGCGRRPAAWPSCAAPPWWRLVLMIKLQWVYVVLSQAVAVLLHSRGGVSHVPGDKRTRGVGCTFSVARL